VNPKMKLPTHVKDMLGKKYEKLTVTELLPWEFKSGRKHYFVKCVCDCGRETVTNALYLKQGNKKHCGCIPPKLSGYHTQRQQFALGE